MQLIDVGRNEPCPCGSGRKYKKCCLATRDAVVAGTATDLDVGAVVDRAIADDDWSAVRELFDQAFPIFEPGSPLEHVRFRDDLFASAHAATEPSRLCTAGWVQRSEQEIVYVLGRYTLDPEVRIGLRMALHLLRRFGASSPLVEELAELQAMERDVRMKTFAGLLAPLGLTSHDLAAGWEELLDWIERERPSILPFADWFALRVTPEADVEALWHSGISMRVCDVCLARLEQPGVVDARQWMGVVANALLAQQSLLGSVLARSTPARVASAEEEAVHVALVTKTANPAIEGAIGRIIDATVAREDFAGAAMLRESVQRVQIESWRR